MIRILSQQNRIAFLLFWCGLILFTIGQSPEVTGFEARFYLFAQEMWRNGPSFFPTTYNHPYPDYTPASTICIYAFSKLFGDLNKFTAVLPSAVAAAVTLSMTYLIATLHDKRMGLSAVFLLLLTFSFFKSGRLVTLDIYPTAITTICFYLIYSADMLSKPSRLHWLFLFFLLGFVFRGPIGLVIITGVVLSYYALDRRWKKVFIFGLLAFFLLIICTGILLALARTVEGPEFMANVLRMQILGRLGNHYQPFYFYFISSLRAYAITYPLALVVIISVFRSKNSLTQTDIQFILKLTGWMIIIFLGMSIPGDKKPRYILPASPAAAIISAYLFNHFGRTSYFLTLQRVFIYTALFVPSFLVLAVTAIYFYDKYNLLLLNIHYFLLITGLMLLQMSNVFFLYVWRSKLFQCMFYSLAIFALSFCTTYIAAFEPLTLFMERGRELVQKVEALRLQADSHLVFYKEEADNLPIKYLIDMPQYSPPLFIKNEKELRKFNQPAFFVTRDKFFLQLPQGIKDKLKIVANDKMGHVQIIIFTKE